jgi:hypothetical protein
MIDDVDKHHVINPSGNVVTIDIRIELLDEFLNTILIVIIYEMSHDVMTSLHHLLYFYFR